MYQGALISLCDLYVPRAIYALWIFGVAFLDYCLS
ncbi:hypothetical protein SAMN04490194_6314 [Pseudomonas migulae]|uniref:Uncharacterized protein n=1 Tax=Pseudomonas migulae TaxID=78543 RepID=A0A1H5NMW1_9PSED|nr:hypothetical protein SAMN04490194_6314 [Pseudomonas migulae]